jgi:hypothetical protein
VDEQNNCIKVLEAKAGIISLMDLKELIDTRLIQSIAKGLFFIQDTSVSINFISFSYIGECEFISST